MVFNFCIFRDCVLWDSNIQRYLWFEKEKQNLAFLSEYTC